MQEGCWNTIERLVKPTGVSILGKVAKKLQAFHLIYSWNTSELHLSSFRSSKKEVNKMGPRTADIEVASKFLISLGAGLGFREAYYAMILDNAVFWMEVRSRIPFRRI